MVRVRIVLLLAAAAAVSALVLLFHDGPRRTSGPEDASASQRAASRLDASAAAVTGSNASRPIVPGRAPARGPFVRGRVIDRAASRPVAHATVRLELTWGEDSENQTAESFDVRTPVTDDGAFCVAVPYHAKFVVTAQAAGFAVAGKDLVGSGDEIELVLDAPAKLSGRVLHQVSREPLSGAEIRVWIPGCPRAVRTARTDAAGTWALDDLPRAEVTFEAHLAGFLWRQVKTDLAGGAAEHEVLLDPGLSISGRVVAADTGNPISGAKVDAWNVLVPALSDERGMFTLSGLWSGTWSLGAHAKGRAAGWAEVVVAGRPVEGVVITMAPGREITGVVVDELDRPLAGVKVEAGAEPIETGADGRFVVGHSFDVEVDSMSLLSRISASREGFSPLSQEVEHDAREVTLRLLPADVTVRGRVEDQEGRPVEGARVSCFPGPPRKAVTGTDEVGAFVFERCPRAPEYEVTVSAPGRVETKAAIRRGEGSGSIEATIVLKGPRHFRVLGTVRDETGAAVAGARVEVLGRGTDGDGHRDRRVIGNTVSGADGRFEVEAGLVRPGPVGLMASAAGYRNAEAGIDSREDVSSVDLALCHLGRISGRVVDAATGEPVGAATIELRYENGTSVWGFFGRTSGTADFSFEAPPGSFQMDVKAERYLFHSRPVDVAARATTEAGTIELSHGGAIEGTIRPAAGCAQKPLGIVLATAGRTHFRWAGKTDSLGWFHLDQIAPGAWEVFGAEEASAYGDTLKRVVRLCSFGAVEVGRGTVGRLDGVMPSPATIVLAARLADSPASDAPARFSAYGPDSAAERIEGNGAPWFRLVIRSLDGLPLALTADGPASEFDGWWQGDALNASIATLPAGRYRVSVASGAHRPAEADVQVEAGATRKVILELRR